MKKHVQKIIKTTASIILLSQSISGALAAAPAFVEWEASSGGNGHFYMAVPSLPGLTWDQANTLAQGQGGYLATITSAAENTFVFGLINNSLFFGGFNGSGPAIGGFNAGTPANPNWSWVTGEAFTYANWLPGSPDYADFGPGPENRLHFFSGVGGTPANTWNDLHQTDQNLGGYIVEMVPEPGALSLLGVAVVLTAFRKKNNA